MTAPVGYLAYYQYRTFSGMPLGTDLFVVDVFTALASVANAVETVFLGNYRKTFGRIDIAADVAQMIFLVSVATTASGTSPNGSIIKMLIVLNLAQDIIMGLEQLSGNGTPVQGSPFLKGKSLLDGVAAAFASAHPDDWIGRASTSYSARTAVYQSVAEKMAAADLHVAGTVNQQSAAINEGRTAFASIRLGLFSAIPIAIVIAGCTNTFNELERYVYTVVGVAGVATFFVVIALINSGVYTAQRLWSVIGVYRDVAIRAGLAS
ncbi:MAG: hypothetical protein K2Q25_08090 [Mycobacteriaceae bacterium]|nr:hypothetical protein [Mycobacteriaceae bacterium]